MVCTWAVAVSTGLAFFATCVPVGMASSSIGLGLVVGVPAAIFWGAWLTNQFRRVGRNQPWSDRDIRYR